MLTKYARSAKHEALRSKHKNWVKERFTPQKSGINVMLGFTVFIIFVYGVL